MVCKFHQIIIVDRPVSAAYIPEICPKSIRSSGIRKEYEITGSCPYLHFMVQNGTERRTRPTVDI